MTVYENYSDCQNCYEYHGNTTVEIVRKKQGAIIERDWLLFDTVEEAQEYFYDRCDEPGVACVH